MKRTGSVHLLAASLLVLAGGCAAQPALEREESGLFERVAIVGASVSAGFNLSQELDARVDLGDVLARVLVPEGRDLPCAASSMFFVDPEGFGERLLAQVQASEPSLVVALDFLFWFGYGFLPGEQARLDLLEVGLGLLEGVECTLLVGDFPDVSHAVHGKGPFGPMIQAGQVPAPETLVALNARLHAWAQERGDAVVLVPMAGLLARLHDGRAIEIHGELLPGAQVEHWLQPDLLHPTVAGTIALLHTALDALERARGRSLEELVEWDAQIVRTRLLRATEAEREERLAKEREREERIRARQLERAGSGA